MYMVVIRHGRTCNAYIKFDEKTALAKMREIALTRNFDKIVCVKMEGSNICVNSLR